MARSGRHRTGGTWGAYSALDEVLRGAELVSSQSRGAAAGYLQRGLAGLLVVGLMLAAHWAVQDAWSHHLEDDLVVTEHYGGRTAPLVQPVTGTVQLVGSCWQLDGRVVGWPAGTHWAESSRTAVVVDGVVVRSGTDLGRVFGGRLRVVPPTSLARVSTPPGALSACGPPGRVDVLATAITGR